MVGRWWEQKGPKEGKRSAFPPRTAEKQRNALLIRAMERCKTVTV